MAKEIERKFLIANNDWKKYCDEGTSIKQGYLSSQPERTVRIRLVNEKGILTIKSKNIGITRNEFEYQIPYKDGLELLTMCEKPLIEKTRYRLTENNKEWEIDIFEGENEGLEIAEIELSHENEELVIPKWLRAEVSHDKRYYNSNLVKSPFKNWN